MLVVLMASIEGMKIESELSKEIIQYMGDAFGQAMSISVSTAVLTGLAMPAHGDTEMPMDIGRYMVSSDREAEMRKAIDKIMAREGLDQVIQRDLTDDWKVGDADEE